MDDKDQKFSVVIPATLEKSEDGEWRVYGLASTAKRDLQGEIMDLKGLDLSPIAKGRGVFNYDHKKGPENTVGVIDQYKKTDAGLYLGGYLFKNHDRAKGLYQIMTSLKKSDTGRMGMSVEGIIKSRDGKDGKVIKNAVITSCALTMNPVNEDTYINLVKSLSSIEFSGDTLHDDVVPDSTPAVDGAVSASPEVMYSADQVVGLIAKALGASGAQATTLPQNLSGGDALAQESLDKDEKKIVECEEDKPKKRLKKLEKGLFKSRMEELLNQLQKLHPDVSRSEIWETVKDRLNRKFKSEKSDEN
jgi:hypothetical protein